MQAWQGLHEDSKVAQEQLQLTERQLQLALAYYREFSDEIDTALALARRSVQQLEQAYPFIDVIRVPSE